MPEAIPDWDKPAGSGEKIPDWDKPPAPQEKPDFGNAVSAGLMQAHEAAGRAAGGWLGGEAGAALGAFGGPAAPVTVPLGAILGGVGGYLGTGYLENKIESVLPSWSGYSAAGRKKEREEFPKATAAGELGVDIPTAGAGLVRTALPTAISIAKGLLPRKLIEKIAKPSTISDVGEKIQSKVESALTGLVKKRKPAADKLFGQYLSQGKAVEGKILADYNKALSEYYAKGVASGKMSQEQVNAVKKAADRLAGRAPELGTAQKEAAAAREAERQGKVAAQGRKIPPRDVPAAPEKADRLPLGIGALEKERRIWNDIASGYDVKGAEGITAQAARDISDLLTKSIRKYVKAPFDAAIEGYKKLSEPINRFNTALGKKVTTKADDFLPDIAKTDPSQVPRAFFKSRRSVQELKELSGDTKFVEQAAREHVANDLAAAKTSEEITAYAQKNRDWLNEFPALQKQLTDAAKSIKTGERAKTVGKYGAAGLVGAGFYNKLKEVF